MQATAASITVYNPTRMTFQLKEYQMSHATRYVGGPLAEKSFVRGGINHEIEFISLSGNMLRPGLHATDSMHLMDVSTEFLICGQKAEMMSNDHVVPLQLLPENVRQALNGLTQEGVSPGLSMKWAGFFSGPEITGRPASFLSALNNWASLYIDDTTKTALLRFEYVFRMGGALFTADSINRLQNILSISCGGAWMAVKAHDLNEGDVEEGCSLGIKAVVRDELTEQAKRGKVVDFTYRTFVGAGDRMLPELKLPFSVISLCDLEEELVSGLFLRGTSLLHDVLGTGAILDLRPEILKTLPKVQ